MSRISFFITDVFATGKYSGNQLATLIHDGRRPDEEMQQVAAEFGFSETTFVMAQEPVDGGYPVRIFTPRAEVDFAGHPTLGTAYIIQRYVIGQTVDRITLNLNVGPITVQCAGANQPETLLWMRQNQPTFEHGEDLKTIAGVIGLRPEDIDARWPISQVTTGLPFTIVPLRNMQALKRARIDPVRYETWSTSVWAKGILVFCVDGYTEDQDLASRVFVPYLGIPEDPATGSASGCLAGYLLHHRSLGTELMDARIGQGYEIGRPSEIHVRGRRTGDVYELDVGGQVLEVAIGDLLT